MSDKSDLSLKTQQSASPTLLPEVLKSKIASLQQQDVLLPDCFSYSLSPLDQLSSSQKVTIHRLLKGFGDSEVFLGYAPVQVNVHAPDKEPRVAIVASKSFILVTCEDYAAVRRKVMIGDIRMITIAGERNAAILHVRPDAETTYSDISMASGKLEDVLKAIQQAHFEAFSQCICTQNVENQSAFRASFNHLLDSQLDEAHSVAARHVTEVSTKHGLVGEACLWYKQAIYYVGRAEEVRHCLITSRAVYCLDEGVGCYGRIPLSDIREVTAVTGKKLIIVSSESQEQTWLLPQSVGETIVKAASRLRRSPLKLTWRSAQSFFSERQWAA